MKADLFRELGRTGLNYQGGYVYEELLPELTGSRWRKVVRQMIDNDAVINAMLFVIEMMIRRVTWEMVPASQKRDDLKAAEFHRGALFDDMSQTWPDTVAEIMTMAPWGWSWFELCFKRRKGESQDPSRNSRYNDGMVGFRKWAIRAQESFYQWELDETGGVQAMLQLAAPDYQILRNPIDKSLLFRTTVHKGNPEGRSLLRGAWRQFYRKWHIENIEGVGVERDLAGLPQFKIPSEILNGTDKESEEIRQYCLDIVTGVRRDEQEGLLIPSDVYEGTQVPQYDFKLTTTGGTRQFDTDKIIQRCDQRMAISVMADFLLLGHTAKSGSYGMVGKKAELFCTAADALLDSVAAVINRHALPRLHRLNPLRGQVPTLKHNGVEKVELGELAAYVSSLTGAGISFDELETKFLKRQIKGMPVSTEDGGGKKKDSKGSGLGTDGGETDDGETEE
jgi:hypothetical protein